MRFLQHASPTTAGIVLLSILPLRARLAAGTGQTPHSELDGGLSHGTIRPLAGRIAKRPVEN
jgi:hypothetical protein